MPSYDNLPVYKLCYDLLLELFQQIKGMDREYKFSIGADIKQEVTHLIANIYRANCTQHKIILLGQARENVEMVRLYLRLLKDLKQVSLPKFIQLNEKIESISKQLSFWQKHASNVGSESQ